MCLDPVSLAMLAGGTALSVGGGVMNNNAQAAYNNAVAQDNANAAAASNAQLSAFNAEQTANEAQNVQNVAPTYARIAPGAFQADQTNIANLSADRANRAIANTLSDKGAGQTPMPGLNFSGTDGSSELNDLAARTTQRVGQSVLDADNAAKLDAYGTNFANMGLVEANSNRNIDTTNNLARSQAALLPTLEQNAALQARQFIAPPDTTTGTAIQGLGNVFASAGGSGLAKSGLSSLSNWFNPGPSVSNPSMAGVFANSAPPTYNF